MRLLHTTSLTFIEEPRPKHPYAILSHTWRDGEITYQEMLHRDDHVEAKAGFDKIKHFCRVAKSQGFDYCWVDTCCIDKSDPTELSEAINSMFRWYKGAYSCVVYLSDVHSDIHPEQNKTFYSSRWFTRGWTLQELLASRNAMSFYTSTWDFICHKSSCIIVLSEITGIEENFLWDTKVGSDTHSRRGHSRTLSSYSIATRMSWAARRETTRPEDKAYCLLGIFNVNMPLIYGEGEHKAFVRLQQEIIKLYEDHSLFSWNAKRSKIPSKWGSIYAPSPDFFEPVEQKPQLREWNDVLFDRKPFMDTNFGVHITLPLIYRKSEPFLWDEKDQSAYAMLDCQIDGKFVCIPLVYASNDATRYYRGSESNSTIDQLGYRIHDVKDIYIMSYIPASDEGDSLIFGSISEFTCSRPSYAEKDLGLTSTHESHRIHEQLIRYRSYYRQSSWSSIFGNEFAIQCPYFLFALTIGLLPQRFRFLKILAVSPFLRTMILCNVIMHPQLVRSVIGSMLPFTILSFFLNRVPSWSNLKVTIIKISFEDIGYVYGHLLLMLFTTLVGTYTVFIYNLFVSGMYLRETLFTWGVIVLGTSFGLFCLWTMLLLDFLNNIMQWYVCFIRPMMQIVHRIVRFTSRHSG